MDKKNLTRIVGILSAQKGAGLPKLQWGGTANYTMRSPRQGLIYSKDNTSWFKDPMLTVPYTGSLDGFSSVGPQYANLMRIPGSLGITPNSAVENSASVTQAIWQKQADIQAEQAAANASSEDVVDEVAKSKRNRVKAVKIADSPEEEQTQSEKKERALSAGMGIATEAFQAVGQAANANQLATDSNLTKGADAAYNIVSEGIKNAGPIGKIVGTAMQNAKIAGDIIQGLGGGTDQQTKMDKWMDSAFFSWNIGMLNGFAGKNTQDFGVDQNIMAQVGGSYGGTVDAVADASEKAGKKYGLFSTKARKKADAAINKARSQQNLMGDIADTASDQRLAAQSMGEQAGLTYSMMTSGGYDQKYTYAAKQGGVLKETPDIEFNLESSIALEWEPQVEINWELPIFKEGGNIASEWIPELQSGNKIRTIEELIEYAKQQNPRFIQRLSEEPRGIKFTDDEGNEAEGSHYLESRGEYVIPRIQEIDGELKFLNPQEAFDRAIEVGNYLEMTPEEAILFAEKYKQGWSDFFEKFKKGGSLGDFDIPEIEETMQKNVIPEGALHKNKHHMEHAEGLTKKGIPVIDDDGDQQAEIEHSEIIFTLEVTKKLEEYYETFYSDESSNKEKEQAALDAGRLLVYQILENTEDRTGLIESCKNGGTLNKKDSPTSTLNDKDLMKEALKSALLELLTK